MGRSICASTTTRISVQMLSTCVGHPGRFLGGGNDPEALKKPKLLQMFVEVCSKLNPGRARHPRSLL